MCAHEFCFYTQTLSISRLDSSLVFFSFVYTHPHLILSHGHPPTLTHLWLIIDPSLLV